MLDPQEVNDILSKHFETISDEQFVENIKLYCPEILDSDFWEESKPLAYNKILREEALLETKAALTKLIATFNTESPSNLLLKIGEEKAIQVVVTFIMPEDLEAVKQKDLSLVHRQKDVS